MVLINVTHDDTYDVLLFFLIITASYSIMDDIILIAESEHSIMQLNLYFMYRYSYFFVFSKLFSIFQILLSVKKDRNAPLNEFILVKSALDSEAFVVFLGISNGNIYIINILYI
jgi:hypothetical protein